MLFPYIVRRDVTVQTCLNGYRGSCSAQRLSGNVFRMIFAGPEAQPLAVLLHGCGWGFLCGVCQDFGTGYCGRCFFWRDAILSLPEDGDSGPGIFPS